MVTDQTNTDQSENRASAERAYVAQLEDRLDALERYETIEKRLAELEGRSTSSSDSAVGTALAFGFGAFGIVVGLLTGLTQSEIVKPLIAALFVLIGGSLAAFLHKLNNLQQRRSGIALALVSIGLIAGVLSGIVVREHRLLGGGGADATASVGQENSAFGYLRSRQIQRCNEVDEEKQRNGLNVEEAYEAMYETCLMSKANSR